jgi:hypothetical protein
MKSKKKDFYWEFKFMNSYREYIKFVSDNKDEFTPYDWLQVSKSQYFKTDMIDAYSDHLDWGYLCTFLNLDIRTMERYSDYLDWYAVSALQPLTLNFIKKHEKELSFNKLISNENIRSTSLFTDVNRMYEQRKNKPEYQQRWKDNLENSTTFRPSRPMQKFVFESKPKYTEEQINKMKKDQLKQILKDNNVRVLYHDTMDELKEKIKKL